MTSNHQRAINLTYQQRKALRRLGRGQTINKSMSCDSLIQQCITRDHYTPPPNIDDLPYPESMFAWCDWAERARFTNRPRLNKFGQELLNDLNAEAEKQ